MINDRRWFHGTTRKNALKILKEGFQPGTYFADNLLTSLLHGGEYVFEIWADFKSDTKQYQCKKNIGTEHIWYLTRYEASPMYVNKSLVNSVREAHNEALLKYHEENNPSLKGKIKTCNHCAGRGQLEDYPRFTHIRDMKKISPCPECRGRGYLNMEEKKNDKN